MELKLRLIHVVIFLSFDMHLFAAALGGNNLIFDERFYVPSGIASVNLVASNIEHPPLVKIIIGLAIKLFGDNWFAWRFPIILFAMLATWLTYKIALKFLSERLAVFSAGLLSLSVVLLLIGSTAMLDVPCLALGLLGLYDTLRGNYGRSGLWFGLSFLCKELGVLMFTATWLYLAIKKTGRWKQLFFVAIAFMVAFGGIWTYDLTFHPASANQPVTNPVEHFYLMILYQVKLNGERATNASNWYPPIAWVTPFGANAWNPWKWMWVTQGHITYNWVAQPNPSVEYWMFPLLFMLPLLYWLKRNILAVLSWIWIAICYLPWFAAGFFVMTQANFYVIFSIPFLTIGFAYLYTFIMDRRLKYGLAITQLIIGIIWFLYYFPIPLFR